MLIAQDTGQPCFGEQLPDNINLHLDTELQFRCSLRRLHCIAPGLQLVSWFSESHPHSKLIGDPEFFHVLSDNREARRETYANGIPKLLPLMRK